MFSAQNQLQYNHGECRLYQSTDTTNLTHITCFYSILYLISCTLLNIISTYFITGHPCIKPQIFWDERMIDSCPGALKKGPLLPLMRAST